MGYEGVKIRDLSRRTGEWTPPIGALGGPPSHQLYTDLVLYAGLQLFRDGRGRPWVVLRDGAQRRSFLAPSPEMRSALDRFRMHRNLGPVPENHINEFVRVVQARVSDPDVTIPLLRSPVVEPAALPEWNPTPPPTLPAVVAPPNGSEERSEPPLRAVDSPDRHLPEAPQPTVPLAPLAPVHEPPIPAAPVHEPPIPAAPVPVTPIDTSVSGAIRLPAGENPGLARYVSIFQTLVQDGSWLGTTEELSHLMQDEPLAMFDSLHKYRSELERRNILVTSVEVEDGFRWLAVDRARPQRATAGRPPDYRTLASR